jgi:RNA polymerase sigma-70 factor (ECF subfamily)
MLRKALARLRPAYQQVLTMRFLNDLGYPETAQVLGRNVNAVRVLQFRALEALRTALIQDGVG